MVLRSCLRPTITIAVVMALTAGISAQQRVTAGWSVTEGINTPESVYFDQASGFVFSSQIVGQPDGRDGNGRIVKLTGDGKVVSANWATGLNTPKGLRACQGTLWTADIDEVVGFDVATAAPKGRVKIAGAVFLNDVTCAPDGTVYVSDMMGNRIHAVKDGKATVFAEGETLLDFPNGLLVDGTRLVVGSFGKPGPDFTTPVPGPLFALDLKTKAKTLITPMPFGNIDGLESDGRGGYVVSDYNAGKILRVSATGESTLIRQLTPGTADIAVAPGGVLIVPHMNDNKIASYDIAAALR